MGRIERYLTSSNGPVDSYIFVCNGRKGPRIFVRTWGVHYSDIWDRKVEQESINRLFMGWAFSPLFKIDPKPRG